MRAPDLGRGGWVPVPIASPLAPAPAARSGCAWRRSQKAALWDGGVPGDYMAIFLADMPPLPPRPPKQHAQISWLAKGGRFYLFSLSRRSHDETSFGSCSGGEDVAPLALLASLGLTTTLVHEKKHEGQHRGKNDRRASQDIKVVRGHEKHSTYDGQHLPRPRPRSSATSEGPSKRSGPRRGFHQLAFMPNDPTSSPLSGPSHEALDRRRTKHASESLDGRAQVLHANSL